jgi:hypothetical protein
MSAITTQKLDKLPTGVRKGLIMSKVAFVILASGDSPEGLGRVVNGLIGAYEMMESGDEVKIIFDGAGTEAAAALAAPDHKYNDVFRLVRSKVSICNYCAGAYGVTPKIEQADLPFAADFKGHQSFKQLLEQQYQIITF